MAPELGIGLPADDEGLVVLVEVMDYEVHEVRASRLVDCGFGSEGGAVRARAFDGGHGVFSFGLAVTVSRPCADGAGARPVPARLPRL